MEQLAKILVAFWWAVAILIGTVLVASIVMLVVKFGVLKAAGILLLTVGGVVLGILFLAFVICNLLHE